MESTTAETRGTADHDHADSTESARRIRAPRDPFVETRSAEKVMSALAYAQVHGDLVCCYGAPGTGKTMGISQYRAMYPHVWIATMTPATAAIVPALEEIAEAVGIRHTSGGARSISRAICDRVEGLEGIVIIDEAQHLKTAAIEQIRSMHDATGVAIALVGNESVYARITGGGRTAAFAQISSRIGFRVFLGKPELEDVLRLAKTRWNVTDSGVIDVLERVSTQPGGLRLVSKVMRSVTSNKRREVTADRVRTAAANLGMAV